MWPFRMKGFNCGAFLRVVSLRLLKESLADGYLKNVNKKKVIKCIKTSCFGRLGMK